MLVLGILLAFGLVVAVFASSGGAATDGRASANGSATFTDPSGDAKGGAPDITTVAVSDDGATGMITIRVTAVGFAAASGQRYPEIVAYLDTDKNGSTGDSQWRGAEYRLILEKQPDGGVFWNVKRWDGSSWVLLPQSSTMSLSRSGDVVGWTVNKSDLGGTTGFGLSTASAMFDGNQTTGLDLAPETGAWIYDLSAPPPPPPPAAASTPTPATGSATFTDPAGDGSGAPDVTSVALSSTPATGTITVKVTAPGYGASSVPSVIYVFLDTDKNPQTGDPGNGGVEYDLVAWKEPSGEYWDFGHWMDTWVSRSFVPTVHFTRAGDVLTWTLNKADLGGATSFDFYVRTATFDAEGNQTSGDYAPNAGRWAYKLSAPAAALKAVIGAPSTSPKKATAGKRFTVIFPVKRSDNGVPLKTGKTGKVLDGERALAVHLTSSVSVAGKAVRHSKQFKNAKARLSFVVPKSAKGKLLTAKATIKVGTKSTTRTARFRVAAPSAPRTAPAAPPTGVNHPPAWPSKTSYSLNTTYAYKDGKVASAVIKITISPAIDPDGDPLSYSWTASSGSITGHGRSATWTVKASGGVLPDADVVVTAHDGHGGTARHTLSFHE